MKRVLVMLAATMTVALGTGDAHAQCSNLPPGCPTCTQCTFPAGDGTQPPHAEIHGLLEQLAENSLGLSGVYALNELEQGPSRVRQPAVFPCVLFKAIAVVESDWRQFCATGKTVISFDCGYGISQITSGVASYDTQIASSAAHNIAAGADILIGKWNADSPYGGKINDSNPLVVENWYYATWAYNGFTNGNNPNNPNLPATRPPYGGPGALSRGSYPYQELVWGRIRFPPVDSGTARYSSVEVTYPNLADIPPPPSSTSLFQQDISINPQHPDPCTDPCAAGCPTPRELIVDNLDPGFSLDQGNPATAAAGGYNTGFRHSPVQPPGSPVVIARFTPDLPSDGVWEVDGYIPLTPATSADIPVVIVGTGTPVTTTMDQSVAGGIWQRLGRAKLRAGHTHVLVRDDSGDSGEAVGFDAIRWRWVGFGGTTAEGGTCSAGADCRDSLVCLDGMCAPPCWESGCGSGTQCDDTSGRCVPGGGSSSSGGTPSSGSTSSSAASGSAASSAASNASGVASSTSGGIPSGSSEGTTATSEPPSQGPFPALPGCRDNSAAPSRASASLLLLALLAVRARRHRGR